MRMNPCCDRSGDVECFQMRVLRGSVPKSRGLVPDCNTGRDRLLMACAKMLDVGLTERTRSLCVRKHSCPENQSGLNGLAHPWRRCSIHCASRARRSAVMATGQISGLAKMRVTAGRIRDLAWLGRGYPSGTIRFLEPIQSVQVHLRSDQAG
jgi:hypothetical protein